MTCLKKSWVKHFHLRVLSFIKMKVQTNINKTKGKRETKASVLVFYEQGNFYPIFYSIIILKPSS